MISYYWTNSYGKKVPCQARIEDFNGPFLLGSIDAASKNFATSYIAPASSITPQPRSPIVDFAAKRAKMTFETLRLVLTGDRRGRPWL
jgi:hypothetical protein